jgi:hypothetical protein
MRSLDSCGGPFTWRLNCGALLAIFRTPEVLPGRADGGVLTRRPSAASSIRWQAMMHLHLLLNHPRKTRTMLSWGLSASLSAMGAVLRRMEVKPAGVYSTGLSKAELGRSH